MTDATRPIVLSIIVPIYNVEPYLKECLDSILEQDLDHYEVLLINDGSTDDSGAIAREYTEKHPAHFHYYEQKNQGVSCARNKGIAQATGTYVIFVDPDDAIKNNSLRIMLDAALQSGSDILVGNFVHWFEDGTTEKNKSIIPADNMSGAEWLTQSLKRRKFLPAIWNKLYKRTLLTEQNILFKPDITSAEDLLLTVQVLLKASSVTCINQVFYKYRHRSESATNTLSKNNAQRRFQSHLEVTHSLIAMTAQRPASIRKLILERTIKLNLTAIKSLAACNQKDGEMNSYFEKLDSLQLHRFVRVSRLSHLIDWVALRMGFRLYFQWRVEKW